MHIIPGHVFLRVSFVRRLQRELMDDIRRLQFEADGPIGEVEMVAVIKKFEALIEVTANRAAFEEWLDDERSRASVPEMRGAFCWDIFEVAGFARAA